MKIYEKEKKSKIKILIISAIIIILGVIGFIVVNETINIKHDYSITKLVINNNDVTGIVDWIGGTDKLVTFGAAGIIVKDATREVVLNNNTLDEWITGHGTIWNSIPVGSMIRVKNYSSDRYSTLICKERN